MATEAGDLNQGFNGSLDIRLLGTVRAEWGDGRPVNLGGPMPKIVLVRLALDAGRTVRTEALVDTLWGEDPPRTARRSLQAHVAKLRSALVADDGPLRSDGSGYTLNVPRSSVDALRIEDNLRAAQEIVETDPTQARELVARCREDWTGDPLADLSGHDFLNAERERISRLGDAIGDLELEVNIALGNPEASISALERAVTRKPIHEPNWMRLIRAYYAGGRQSDALDAYRRASAALLEHLGVNPSPQLQRLELQVLQQELTEEPQATCPYKGLTSYQLDDGANFYGRSETIKELTNLVSSTAVSVVVGPSGVGKSSVLRAGLAHRVINGRVPGIKTVAVMTPGLQPLRSLYAADSTADLLIVDQFEELFVLTDDPNRQKEFVDELLAVASSGQTHVVISVRADFYSQCLLVPALSSILGRYQINIGAMSKAELREAIESPAVSVGLEVEPALVTTLIDEVAGRPGALPLLSHALSETWRHRYGTDLTLGSYEKSGRIAGAISATAERVYESLDKDGRAQIELLFGRLVGVGSDVVDTRRVVPRSEIDSSGFSSDLVDRLVAVRLLTATTDEVEIAHEAMISSWPRLADWLDSERDHLITHQRLNRAANAWDDGGRDDGELYGGNRLAATLMWQSDSAPLLSKLESGFLTASEDKELDERSMDRRATRRVKSLAGLAVVALVVAGSAAWFAIGRSRDAEESRGVVDAIQLASSIAVDESLTTANRLRVAAGLRAQTAAPETSGLLLDTLIRSPAGVSVSQLDIVDILGSAPVASSGGVIPVAVPGAGWSVLDLETFELIGPSPDITPRPVIATADGLLVIDDNYRVLDAVTGDPVGPALQRSEDPIASVLSPDGKLIALGYGTADIQPAVIEVFDVASGSLSQRIVHVGPASDIRELEINATGTAIVLVESFQFWVWDLTSGEPLGRTEEVDPEADISSTAFNRAGDSLVLGRTDGTVEIWRSLTRFDDKENGVIESFTRPTFVLLNRQKAHGGAVSWIEYAADGHIASSAEDGSVVVWNGADGGLVSGPVGFDSVGFVTSFFEGATGNIVTIDSRGTTWRWDPFSFGGLLKVAEAEDVDRRVAEAGGRQVFVEGDAEIVVVDGAGELVGELLGVGLRFDPVWNVSLNDAGTDLVYSTRDGELIWVSLETFEEVELLPKGFGHDAQFVSATQVVAVGTDGVQLIDLDTPEISVVLPFGLGGVGVAYDAGRGLAATVALAAPCFCPRDVILWDPATGQQLGTGFSPLSGASVRSLRFDGSELVAWGAERVATLSLDPEVWQEQACALAESLDPGGELPPDPRTDDIRACR